jgi:photosystem II stability/assembly factor-like uncharacterized protein
MDFERQPSRRPWPLLTLCLALGFFAGCSQPKSHNPGGFGSYLLRRLASETAPPASFRGVSCAANGVAWASGSSSSIYRSGDWGQTWQKLPAPGKADLDFRDVHAFDFDRAIVMAAGPGEASALYATQDGGDSWQQLLANPDEKGFFDSIAMNADGSGFLIGDPIEGHFTLYASDQNQMWHRVAPPSTPVSFAEEYCFAASGTAIALTPKGTLWLATGGAKSRLLQTAKPAHRPDQLSWLGQPSSIGNGEPSQGVFSVAFRDELHGVAVGGDYSNPLEAKSVCMRTSDGGNTWQSILNQGPSGFRSGVCHVPGTQPPVWVAVGSHGADWSQDDGLTWLPLPNFDGYHAIAFGPDGRGVAVGSPNKAFLTIDFLPLN